MAFNHLAALCLWAVLHQAASAFYSRNGYYQNNLMSPAIPMQGSEYNQFSTCFYVNLKSPIPISQQIPILSYLAGDAQTAEIVFQLEYERQMSGLLIGGGKGAYFPMVPPTNQWTHVCFTWDSYLGLVNAYVDGESMGTANGIQTGYRIPGLGFWNVGLPQLDVGQVAQLHFWDRVISSDEVQQTQKRLLTGNVLSWYSPVVMSEDLPTLVPSSDYRPQPDESSSVSCLEHPVISPLDMGDLDFEEILSYTVEGVFNRKLPPLRNLSFCAWLYTEKDADIDPLGVYDKDSMEIFGIFIHDDGSMSLQVGEKDNHEEYIIPVLKTKPYSWGHYCITWSGLDGTIQVFVNGELKYLNGLMKGYTLPAGNKLRVKQLQHDNKDSKAPMKGFGVKITDVNWWDHVITEDAVTQVYSCSGSLSGNIFSWNEDTFQLNEICLGTVTTSLVVARNASLFAKGKKIFVRAEQKGVNPMMKNVSFCAWSFRSSSLKTGEYAILFVRGIEEGSGSFVLSANREGYFIEHGRYFWNIEVPRREKLWYHTCATFESNSGTVQFYLDGKLFVYMKNFQAGELIGISKVAIQHHQTEAFDEADPTKGFITKTTAVNVWDYVITDDIAHDAYCGKARGNVFNNDTEYEFYANT